MLGGEYRKKGQARPLKRCSVYLLYWYKSTKTDAVPEEGPGEGLEKLASCALRYLLRQYLCFCTSKASKLSTKKRREAAPAIAEEVAFDEPGVDTVDKNLCVCRPLIEPYESLSEALLGNS